MRIDRVCAAGHDLTRPEAYVYSASGTRACRECLEAARPPGRRRAKFRDETTAIGRWSG